MSILPQSAPIYAPTFKHSAENRAHLIAVIEEAQKSPLTRKEFFAEIHGKTGADWLIIRNLIKGLPTETFEKSPPLLKIRNSSFFDENRLLSDLARQLKNGWHDFAVFAGIFDEYRITLQSLQTLIASSKKLRNHNLHAESLLEKIAFVSMSNASTIAKAIPLIFAYAFTGDKFYFGSRGLAKIYQETLLNTDDDFWGDCYGFEFSEFNCLISIENDGDELVQFEMDSSTLSITGIEYEIKSDLKTNLPAYFRAIMNAAFRTDANLCHRILESSTGYNPFPVRATSTAAQQL